LKVEFGFGLAILVLASGRLGPEIFHIIDSQVCTGIIAGLNFIVFMKACCLS
jgi:hypothetical protein